MQNFHQQLKPSFRLVQSYTFSKAVQYCNQWYLSKLSYRQSYAVKYFLSTSSSQAITHHLYCSPESPYAVSTNIKQMEISCIKIYSQSTKVINGLYILLDVFSLYLLLGTIFVIQIYGHIRYNNSASYFIPAETLLGAAPVI